MAWVVQKTRATKRIESPDGQSYIVIQKLNQRDKDDILDVLASMDIKGKSKEQLTKMNLGQMKRLERVRSIIEWNLTDENGNRVPISEENINNLPDDVIDAIDTAIDELNPVTLSNDKKKE